ncbi:MAG TPA: L,D-transpeptidase family protein [Oscillatoriaceae cyanobacterium]
MRLQQRGLTLGVMGALAIAGAARAATPPIALLPGAVTGSVVQTQVKPGDSLDSLSMRYRVNPERIWLPNAGVLHGPLKPGMTLYVDTREIQPTFAATVSGISLNVPEAEVFLLQNGAIVRQYPVAVSRSDWEVPLGTTKVVDMEQNPTWHVPKDIQAEMQRKGETVMDHVDPGPKNPLGVRWIGFADGTFGFHGTDGPERESIKRYASHGCVRFLNEDILDLYGRVHQGETVHIFYQPVLLAADDKGVWVQVYPDIYHLKYDFAGTLKQLAQNAHVGDRIDWKLADKAIQDHTGVLTQIGLAPGASASPASAPAAPRP